MNRIRWFLPFQVAVAIIAVTVVLRQVPLGNFSTLFAALKPQWVLVAIVFVVGAWGFSAARFRILLAAFGIFVTFRRALLVNGYGAWYSLFLPGAVSGDIVKALHLGVSRARAPELGFAILFDKIIGVLPLLLFGAMAAWIVPGLDERVRLFLAAMVPCTIVVLVGCAWLPIPKRFISSRWASLQKQWYIFLVKPQTWGRVLAHACGTHVCLALSVAALATGFGIPEAAIVAVAAYAVSSVLALIPVTIAGIGIREGTFALLFSAAGYPTSLAVTIALFLLVTIAGYGITAWVYGIRHAVIVAWRTLWRTVMRSGHLALIVISALIASALVFPMLTFSIGEPGYQGIYMSAASDEEHYVSIIREVSEGRWLHRNTYLFEEKQAPAVIAQWGDLPIGFLFRLWPGSIGTFVLCIKWLGIFGTSWLLLIFVRRIAPSLPLSWRAASVVGFFVLPAFLGPDIVTRFWSALQGHGPWEEFLSGVRLTNPVASAVLWALSLVTLERLWRDPRWSHTFWHGIVLGLLGWCYFYFWAFTLTATVVMALWRLLEYGWHVARWYVMALCTTVLISAPMFLLLFQGIAAGDGQTSFQVASHAPIIEKSIFAIAVLLGAWVLVRAARARKRPSREDTFLMILLLSALFVVNQQILTGISIQPHHFYFFTNLPIASFVVVLVGGFVVCRLRSSRWALATGVMACVILLWMGVGVQVASVRNQWEEYAGRQRFAAAFTEIRSQPLPFVVLSDNRISELVTMYTGADVLYAHHAASYPSTSQERRIFSWYLLSWLEGARNVEDARQLFIEQREWIGIIIFEGQYYRELCGSYGCFPDEEFEALIDGYSDFLERAPEDHFYRYRVDAVLWDERTYPEWRLEQYPFLQRAWSGDGVSLWLLKRNPDTVSSL